MITLLHFSDLHLGTENYGRLDPQTGLSSRLQDFLRSFDAIVDYAIGENIDLVLFCGDAYRTRDPTPTYQREFAKRISRLSRASIPTFLLAGNHDLPLAVGKAHTLEIFDTLDVDNVVVANRLGTHTVETRGGPIQMVAVPWPIRSHLAAKDEFKGLKLDEINARLADAIEDLVSEEIDELDPALPTVLAAHGTVFGATYGSERSVLLGQEVIIPSSLVANPAFDYVALGHIHKHQIVRNADPPAVYSGSVERIDFGEEDEQKGFLLVQVEKGRAEFEFVPLEARPFLTIDVEAKGEDPTAEVLEAIKSQDIRDNVVRLIVRTTVEKEPLLKDSEIFQSLEGAFHVATINKQVERRVRLRLGSRNYEEMTPREILETYLKVKQVPSGRTEVLLRYADELFQDLD
jgi:exonuclease SbcD